MAKTSLPEGAASLCFHGLQSLSKSPQALLGTKLPEAVASAEEGECGGVSFGQLEQLREGGLTNGWLEGAGGSNLGLRGVETVG